jgi:hypothetical protein
MAEKSFLDRAAEYTYKELERVGGDPSKLEVPLQTVAVLYSVQAIIDNGGFQYLFENDSLSRHLIQRSQMRTAELAQVRTPSDWTRQ